MSVVMSVALSVAAGCGASKAQVAQAKSSGYDTSFARVYTEVLAVVRKDYPNLTENASAGVIKTAWHQVRSGSQAEDPPKNNQGNAQGGLFQAASATRKLFFIRFTVRVLGGDPWRVSIVGQASEWDQVIGVPSELKGGDEPHWLEGRENGLRVAIYDRLEEYAVTLPDTAKTKTVATTSAPAPVSDVSALGDIPPAAASVVGATLSACKSRDFAALAATMRPEFTWSLGAPPSSSNAVMMWQADSNVLGQLVQSIEAGCRTDQDGKRVTCPPAYTEEPGYIGYRAGFEQGPDGAWKMTFFLSGD